MEKQQIYNPYLPPWDYVPDGEPHVFGNRVYVYGSHDRSGGRLYCMDDYVCWSAPVEDLTNWSCSGVIYRKEQDPHFKNGIIHNLYAPDVVRGNDGRYYLYYALSFHPMISVAVCNSPDGMFEYLGDVKLKTDKADYMPFDPAVFRDDDGRIFLYFGSCFKSQKKYLGAMCVQLADDMVSLVGEPKPIVPNVAHSSGTEYVGHEFFEAASMRKFNDRYYFIYSSIQTHELCCAISAYPDRDFTYCGTILSNADIGLNGRKREDGVCHYANNHGSIERINGRYYVFGHRHTQHYQSSRQGIAQEIEMDAQGHFKQAELTSDGLNGAPLKTDRPIPAYIVCNLIGKNGCLNRGLWHKMRRGEPRVMQTGKGKSAEHFIASFGDGCIAGFKDFSFLGREKALLVRLRGNFTGTLYACVKGKTASPDPRPLKHIVTRDTQTSVQPSRGWHDVTLPLSAQGENALFLFASGRGQMDIQTLTFVSE